MDPASYGLNCLHMCLTIYTSVMHPKGKRAARSRRNTVSSGPNDLRRAGWYSQRKNRLALDWKESTLTFIHDSPNPKSRLVGNYFRLWRRFAEESIHKIQDSASHVVLADITAYYENIDIGLLLSDLRAIGAEPAILEMLSKCLNKWSLAAVPGRSLPQGFSPSNILARFYLNQADRALRERGVHHLRYVDDIRLFCRSEAEAKRHFVELIPCSYEGEAWLFNLQNRRLFLHMRQYRRSKACYLLSKVYCSNSSIQLRNCLA